jgi:ABC-type lipoprotein release transport system permease subunit
MGRTLLVFRLAAKDLRHRPGQALLLLLAIATCAATLALGLALQGTTDNPYGRTRAATNGPDVVATLLPDGSNISGPATSAHPGSGGPAGSADPSELRPLEHAAGVAAHSGPFPVTWTLLRMAGTTASAEVEGRNTAPSFVDRPKLTQGTWVRPGEVVVEAAFANSLGVHVGDRLTVGGRSFRVAGLAVTAAIPDYPNACAGLGCFLAGKVATHNPGLVWATEADARHIASAAISTPLSWFLNLKLSDPVRAAAFADRHNANTASTARFLYPWQHIRDGDAQAIAKTRQVLITGSWLLALLAIASVTVLVGGRMAEQTRRVGLLKAVGGTPGLVAVVLLFQHVLIGLAIGWLTAPLLDGTGAGLLGAPGTPALSAGTVGFVVALALAVAIVATFVPAISAARRPTVAALEDSPRAPRRRAALIRLSAHLPAPLLLGTRLALRRPRRLLLSVFSIALTASTLVGVLIGHATLGTFMSARVTEATTIISVMLVILASVNTVFIAWATALDTRHPAALARVLGATPRQITAGVSVVQLLPALAGALLGIPGGIVLYLAPQDNPGPAMILPVPWVLVVVAATLLVVALLTALPATVVSRFGSLPVK